MARRPKTPEQLDGAASEPERVEAELVPNTVFRDLAERAIADKILGNAKYSGFALGIGVAVILVGAGVIAYLLLRRRDNLTGGLGSSQGISPVTIINQPNFGGGVPAQLQGAGIGNNIFGFSEPRAGEGNTILNSGAGPESGVSYDTVMRSYTVKTSSATRVFTAAGERRWRVTVRTISPPGSFGVFSTDPTQLMQAGLTVGQDTLIVPVGGENTFIMKPRDVLYAKGNMANVVVSVTAGVEEGSP